MFSFGSSSKTVADLLGTSMVKAQRLGQSGARNVFALGEGLSEYVLRIESHVKPISFKSRLMRTTSLHSPDQLATGLAIGQPLLHSHPSSPVEFSIHRREFGVPIKSIVIDSGNQHAEAGMTVMKPLLDRASQGENPLQEPIDTCYRLLRDGRKPDLLEGNVLLDAVQRRIRLVDQVDMRKPKLDHDTAIRELRDCANWLEQTITQGNNHAVHRHTQQAPKDYDASLPRIRDLIDKAVRSVEAREAPGAMKGPVFRTVADHKVALSSKKRDLTQTLRSLDAEIGL